MRSWLGLGANLGCVQLTLKAAIGQIAKTPGITCLASSSLYRTQPIDAVGPDYCNAVMAIQTSLSPQALLATCQKIEADFGRVRTFRHAPRTLDIDILLYENSELNQADLVIPHPRLTERAFVLIPLIEINPDMVIPGQHGRADAFLSSVAGQRTEKISEISSAACVL